MTEPKNSSIRVPAPATVGVDHNRIPKRPNGWPEQAIPVRNRPTPGDAMATATLPLTFVKRKEPKNV